MESSTVIPPGGTWFDTLRKSFVDVPIDSSNNDAVATTEFLEAAESLTSLFSMFKASDIIGIATTAWPEADFMVAVLGSVAFTPVKSDMLGNIKVLILWYAYGKLHSDSQKESTGTSIDGAGGR